LWLVVIDWSERVFLFSDEFSAVPTSPYFQELTRGSWI